MQWDKLISVLLVVAGLLWGYSILSNLTSGAPPTVALCTTDTDCMRMYPDIDPY